MANNKINEKRLVEKIKARILLESGKKITKQDLIDNCISYSYNHFDNFMQEKIEIPMLSKEKIKKILNSAVEFEDHYPDKTDDEVIYGS